MLFKKLSKWALYLLLLIMGLQSQAQVALSVTIAPPPLPVYTQPACPVDGYHWVPGYWAYGPDGYYWVPGVWVSPPTVGVLWTPGYWGYQGAFYRWHEGYWGPHIGFYGGINYGFGYPGHGFWGGEWRGNNYHYNTAVTNVNTTVVHNTYINKTVINNTTNNTQVQNRNSFNGGNGVNERPRQEEEQASREAHVAPTSEQATHRQAASGDKTQLATHNHGQPERAAAPTVQKYMGRTEEHANRAAPAEKVVNENRSQPNKSETGEVRPEQGRQPAQETNKEPSPVKNESGPSEQETQHNRETATPQRRVQPQHEHHVNPPPAHENAHQREARPSGRGGGGGRRGGGRPR